jgi:transcriptional regulator GlxA family with amidase domain
MISVESAAALASQRFVRRATNVSAEARHIGILIFDGHYLITTGMISEVFQLANRLLRFESGQPAYRISILSKFGGAVKSASSIDVLTQRLDTFSVADFHALFVASNDVRLTSGFDVERWLAGGHAPRQNLDRDAPGVSVKSSLARRPAVPVFWIGSNSVAAWAVNQKAAQMALAQIASDHGEDVSMRIASSLPSSVFEIAKVHSEMPGLGGTVDRIHKSIRWMRENFDNDIGISDAAAVAAMSKRNYLRRFKGELGVTPLEYLMQLRLDATRSMLVDTRLPVDKIARRCGMSNGDHLRRLFRKRYGMSPTVYRKLSLSQCTTQ